MKIKTSLFLVIIFLISCSNKKEHIYNETVTRIYFNVSDHFEKVYEKFNNEEYPVIYEYKEANTVADPDGFFLDSKNADIRNLNQFVTTATEQFYMLEPSDNAKSFHTSTAQYFDLVRNDFAKSLEAYINCSSPEQKDSITNAINQLYEKISDHEDEMQKTQIQYIEKEGYTPQPRE